MRPAFLPLCTGVIPHLSHCLMTDHSELLALLEKFELVLRLRNDAALSTDVISVNNDTSSSLSLPTSSPTAIDPNKKKDSKRVQRAVVVENVGILVCMMLLFVDDC